MKKEDLKKGMAIELRCGRIMYLFDTEIGYSAYNAFGKNLDKINADLTNWEGMGIDFDIVKVYMLDGLTFNLLWEREEENSILTLDGVEYSESTLRSLIKKATK